MRDDLPESADDSGDAVGARRLLEHERIFVELEVAASLARYHRGVLLGRGNDRNAAQ